MEGISVYMVCGLNSECVSECKLPTPHPGLGFLIGNPVAHATG